MPRFEGIPIETEQAGGRFGGVPVDAEKKQEEDQGFQERLKERWSGREKEVKQTFEDYGKGEIGFPQASVQYLGKAIAGSALDLVGEGLISTGKGISEAVPDTIEKPIVDAANEVWTWLADTGAGKKASEALEGGVEKWNGFKEEYPQAAKTVESVVNIGLVLAPAKTKANAEPSMLGKTSTKLKQSAELQAKKTRAKFINDLITPERNKKQLIAETSRTSEKWSGPLKHSVVELSKREKEVAAEVSKIAGVSKKKSIQGNLNEIVKANENIAIALDRDVGTRKILGLSGGTSVKIDDAVASLIKENPVITGNAETVANKIATKAKEIIASKPSTPKGLLDSRKKLDQWIRNQKGSKVFDPELESAVSVSVRTVRNTINDAIEANTGSVAVKNELKRQSLLYDAIENLGPKAAVESNYAIGRALQNIGKILPWRRSFQTDVGALMGLGIIGSSETLAPIFAGGVAATAVIGGGYKLVMAPKTKIALGKLIEYTDKALITSKNPSMVKQLRADRALMVELMKNAEVIEESQDNEE